MCDKRLIVRSAGWSVLLFIMLSCAALAEPSAAWTGGAAVYRRNGGGGGGCSPGDGRPCCYVATCSVGTSLEPSLPMLRKFRDERLMTNSPGRLFVKAYYRVSPKLAEFARQHELMRQVSFLMLAPLLYGIQYPGAALCALLATAGCLVGSKALARANAH